MINCGAVSECRVTPELIDIHVLSPLAWIKREVERVEKESYVSPKLWGSIPHSVSLRAHAENAEQTRLQATDGQFLTTEEYHRRLEWELIQVATHAVLWIDAIRAPKPILP